MSLSERIPVAQYLRMSTEHQQYSLQNQADTIARYATEHGFEVVKTYSDAAKSGLRLKNRDGLKQLLSDVMEGRINCRAVLVYDVSRWGRFQDTDEAAHYEYLCKSSGVPVHYCAEQFPNDNSISGLILKALKRTMAGEYSRELSAKVRAGQRRLATLGYKLGGTAPYGLRRMLLDSGGKPKQVLAPGEYKSLATERVVFVPGPLHEVTIVRRIFREFAEELRSMHGIARGLNAEGVPYKRGGGWNAATIRRVLQHAAYMGTQVWGRTSSLLSGPKVPMPPQQWVTCDSAFEPIIDRETFERAQLVFSSFPHNLTADQILERLRTVFRERGKLSSRIIQQSPLCPGVTTIRKRLGGLRNVYARLGLFTWNSAPIVLKMQLRVLRDELIRTIAETLSDQLRIVRPARRHRALLKIRKTGQLISVVLAKCSRTQSGKLRWLVRSPRGERNRVTILALLSEDNTAIDCLLVFRKIPFKKTQVPQSGEWLRSGIPLKQFPDLLEIARGIRRNQRD